MTPVETNRQCPECHANVFTTQDKYIFFCNNCGNECINMKYYLDQSYDLQQKPTRQHKHFGRNIVAIQSDATGQSKWKMENGISRSQTKR